MATFAISPYGRSALGWMRAGHASAYPAQKKVSVVGETIKTALVSSSAFTAAMWSARSNINGGGGKLFGKVPIPLAMAGGAALVAAVAAKAGSPHAGAMLDIARGALAAQATMMGIKYAYSGTGKPVTVAALPRPGLSSYMGPGVGATPDVEAMFRQAGLVPA